MMATVMVMAMLATATPAADASADPAEVETQSAKTLYNQGTQALDRSEWDAAADAFERVVALKDGRADAALYWRAYALNKSGKRDAASEDARGAQGGLSAEPMGARRSRTRTRDPPGDRAALTPAAQRRPTTTS